MKKKAFSSILLTLLMITSAVMFSAVPYTLGDVETVKAFVVDSWGTDYAFLTLWDYLNANWMTYGSIPVMIDYTFLNKENIALDDLIDSGADVLIISDAWSNGYGDGWEYSDDEIQAIKDYVTSGHGIIATAGSFDTYSAPNNRKLADLFGMDTDIWYQWGYDGEQKETSGPFELQIPRHPELWINIPNPYETAGGPTMNPEPTNDWTQQGITTGWLEAITPDHYAAVITSEDAFHRSLYVTTIPEQDHNTNDEQFFYNAIVWAGTPAIAADIDIDPDTLNLRSKGRWIAAYIELPEGYDVSNIDRTTILLNDTVPVDPFWVDKRLESVVGDHDNNATPDLMVKFDRKEVMELLSAGEATLTITGKINGTRFEGSDTVRVLGE